MPIDQQETMCKLFEELSELIERRENQTGCFPPSIALQQKITIYISINPELVCTTYASATPNLANDLGSSN